MKIAWIWIILGAVALLLRWGAGFAPELVENFYSRGVFLSIRRMLDVLGLIPFPLVYALLLLLFFRLARGIVRLFRSNLPAKERLKSTALKVGGFVGATIFFFLFLWGFNYARQPIEAQIGIDVQPLSVDDLRSNLEAQAPLLAKRRLAIGKDSIAIQTTDLPEDLETEMRTALQGVLNDLRYPWDYHPKVQALAPKGILIRFQTLGVYFPWTGECNIDAGLHAMDLPFVMAHEMAHGYGFGDEGTCNFLAYLACLRSEHPVVQYVGHFEYYVQLLINYRRYQPDAYDDWLRTLPAPVKADWNDVILTYEQYPDIFPSLRRATYNAYLKAQGIEEGILNYNRILMLVEAWNEKKATEN